MTLTPLWMPHRRALPHPKLRQAGALQDEATVFSATLSIKQHFRKRGFRANEFFRVMSYLLSRVPLSIG
jgi:hypothetical protein